jgi:hypothetical protein
MNKFSVADEREKVTRCTVTCQEPGCSEQIRYDSDDIEVPLYCWKHRSREGRHSAVRGLR